MDNDYRTLLEAAVWAPSGDDTQPWRFTVDENANTITIAVDETRDPSPMNSGQRMARIAVGAAAENVLQTAASNNWSINLEDGESPDDVLLRIQEEGNRPLKIDNFITDRVTNRRPYDGRPLANESRESLIGDTPALNGVETHWIVDRDRIDAIAALVGRADSLMFGEPSMRRAFLSKVRFDVSANETVDEGLSLGSLELGKMDRFALRMMPYLPNWFVWISRTTKVMGTKSRRLMQSASGVCLVVAPDSSPSTDITVGRAMQRAWLAMTKAGMAVQPMMSLLVLENVTENAPADVIDRIGRERLEKLRNDFRDAAPQIGTHRPAYLMRFGYADPPSARCGRLPVEAFLQRA